MKKTKVVFFIEPEWVYGRIHYDLMKYLWAKGIDCSLLPWNKSYTLKEFQEIDRVTDFYMTTPHGWRFLGYDYKAAHEKTIIVSHSKIDYKDLIDTFGYSDYEKFRRFGCVSNWLVNVAKEMGISRTPEVVPLGINYNSFFAPISDCLQTIGFAGAFNAHHNHHIKRAHLVKEIANRLNMKLEVAQFYHNSYVTMPGFYPSVDVVICSSTEEGAGVPALEAGAAGRLVITTQVGHWDTKITNSGADFVDIDEKLFIEQTIQLITMYRDFPEIYKKRCLEIQNHAKSYDWEFVIDKWADLFK